MRKKMRVELFGIAAGGLAMVSVAMADVTYTLQFDPASSAEAQQVANSVAEAVEIINLRGSFNKHWNVYHNPGIPTAEANYTGYMGYGGTRNTRVVFHEGAHTFGMGTTTAYANLIAGGVWGGQYGNQAQFETYNDYTDGLHGDGHAIWPGGFNYDSEDGYIERIWMLRVMAGIRSDMGIMAYTREARNELVHPGETASFSVESPVAYAYQWYKDGAPLSNGGDISGANSDTLLISNAEVADEGEYYCAGTGGGETLNSRPRQLWVVPAREMGQWDMDGSVMDSAGSNHGTAYGSPSFVAGRIGQAVDLDGIDDYVDLPDAIGYAKNMTVATWVNWDGGNNWQRIFDFGNDPYQNIFLTPKSGGGTMRLSFRDAVNGPDGEQQINATVLPTGQWVHLAAVLKGDYATLYVNGQAVGSVFNVAARPSDILSTRNYIGKSQYNDPLFNGRIDDFRIYNHALDGSAIWELWGQNANQAPIFGSGLILLPPAVHSEPYIGYSLSGDASDADLDTLTFSKLDGPSWLAIAADGTLSGTPAASDVGENRFIVRAQDPSGASSDAEVRITVVQPPINFRAGPLAYWDFNDPALGAAEGTALPDSDGSTVWRVAAVDKSGNGNDLTTWDHAWAGFDWKSYSQQDDFSMKAAGSYPAAFTWSEQRMPSIDIETAVLTNFTVEALVTTSGSGFRTVVGRDARNVASGDGNLAAFYLGLNPDNHPRVIVVDEHGTRVDLEAAGVTVPNDESTWYHLAAVKKGDALSLYVNQVLRAQTSIAGLGALAIGISSGDGWHAGGWSVGRGLWSGNHTDRWLGHVDAASISGVALTPGSFVITGAWPEAYEFYFDDYGIPGAAFDGDADANGVLNGVEYYLGSDPTNAVSPGGVLGWLPDYSGVVHPYNMSVSGVTGVVEWATDLMSSNWFDTGMTSRTNGFPGEIEILLPGVVTNQLFFRLKVTH